MHTITIKSQRDMGDQLLVKITFDGGRGANVHIPKAALANRRTVYGLNSDQQAIDAILKETAMRELALKPVEHKDPRIATMGGLRADVNIKR